MRLPPLAELAPSPVGLCCSPGPAQPNKRLPCLAQSINQSLCSPFVVHLKPAITELAKEYQGKGVKVVAISSNSAETHPQVGLAPAWLQAQSFALQHAWQAARQAAACHCTPGCRLGRAPGCTRACLLGSAPGCALLHASAVCLLPLPPPAGRPRQDGGRCAGAGLHVSVRPGGRRTRRGRQHDAPAAAARHERACTTQTCKKRPR